MNAQPFMIAVGGGKGGVGKSMVSCNLAVHYALSGIRTTLSDLDFGAANVHTIFGLRNPERGLGDYFLSEKLSLSSLMIPTTIPALHLIPGSGFVPELANLDHRHKLRLLKDLKLLDVDLVLLDLGAGTSSNVIDFFALTHAGLVVTTPEPTSIVNAYEFIKNIVYRILFRLFKNEHEILNLIKETALQQNRYGIKSIDDLIVYLSKKHSWASQMIQEVCENLDFYLVLNQAKKISEVDLGKKLYEISKKYLSVSLNFGGVIFYSEDVCASVNKMSPLAISAPQCHTASTLSHLSKKIFNMIAYRRENHKPLETFEEQYERVCSEAEKSFVLNQLKPRNGS